MARKNKRMPLPDTGSLTDLFSQSNTATQDITGGSSPSGSANRMNPWSSHPGLNMDSPMFKGSNATVRETLNSPNMSLPDDDKTQNYNAKTRADPLANTATNTVYPPIPAATPNAPGGKPAGRRNTSSGNTRRTQGTASPSSVKQTSKITKIARAAGDFDALEHLRQHEGNNLKVIKSLVNK